MNRSVDKEKALANSIKGLVDKTIERSARKQIVQREVIVKRVYNGDSFNRRRVDVVFADEVNQSMPIINIPVNVPYDIVEGDRAYITYQNSRPENGYISQIITYKGDKDIGGGGDIPEATESEAGKVKITSEYNPSTPDSIKALNQVGSKAMYDSLSNNINGITDKFVPKTRKINNKELSADISLTPSDIGASPTGHTHGTSSIITGILPTARGGMGTDSPNTFLSNNLTSTHIGDKLTKAQIESKLTGDISTHSHQRVGGYKIVVLTEQQYADITPESMTLYFIKQ